MKRFLFIVLCLSLAASLQISLVAAQAPPQSVDPEPPVKPLPPPSESLGGTVDGASILATLTLDWTASTADKTNSLAWGDYDLDGDLDLLVGNVGDNYLYANEIDQGGTLTQVWAFHCLDGAENTRSVAWADFDQDDDLDVAVGNTSPGKSCVFWNNGDGSFDPIPWVADALHETTSIAGAGWEVGGEYDGYLAIGNSREPSSVFRYEADDFNWVWSTPAENTWSLAWGDYDQDGDPDLATGNYGEANVIYRNNGSGAPLMTPIFATTEVSFTNSVAWGDMDGDGDLDLAMGNGGTTGRTDPDQVYCNGGPPAYTFSSIPCWESSDLSPTDEVAWGDLNGDGLLDLAASSEANGETRIYLNTGTTLNGTAGWDADDDEASSRSVAWADWDGDGDLELAIGYYLDDLGSPEENVVYDNVQGSMIITDVSADSLDTRSVAWGDLDGDGLLDLAVGNSDAKKNQIFLNMGGSFGAPWETPEIDNTRSVAWGDYDDDGDLDLAVGNGSYTGSDADRLYRNTAGALALWQTYGGGDTYGVAWGDFDGDRDLDLAVANYDEPAEIYLNGADGGDDYFTGTLVLDTNSDRALDVAWADFDQDFDLDLALARNGRENRVYVNEGGTLSTTITLPGGSRDTHDLDWGDWNGDGYADLAIGNASEGVHILQAKEVAGVWSFQEVWSQTGLDVRSVAWGDYDGDGDLDLAVGTSGLYESRNRLYRNEGGTLVRVWIQPGDNAAPTRSVAWGDYDNDGDLDLAVGNTLALDNPPNRIYANTWNDEVNLANDPAFVVIDKPGYTENAWFFANYKFVGMPTLGVDYTLFDDESDRAFKIEPQVSWDGGGTWEAAWEAGGDGTSDLAASPAPTGTAHVFTWDVRNQLFDHQGISIPGPAGALNEEMDVAFRIKVWSNPEHGGLIQRPAFGSDTSLFRVDMRPDLQSTSYKEASASVVELGDVLTYTIYLSNTGAFASDVGMVDPIPACCDYVPNSYTASAPQGGYDAASEAITWTGTLSQGVVVTISYAITVGPPVDPAYPVITNTVYVSEPLSGDFTVVETTTIWIPDLQAHSYKQVSTSTAELNDLLTYTVYLSNTGGFAPDVELVDPVPTGSTYVPGSLWSSDGGATYNPGSDAIVWSDVMSTGTELTVTFAITAGCPTSTVEDLITNTAEVNDGVLTNTLVVTTGITPPDLSTSEKLAHTSTITSGESLTYTVVVRNTGGYAPEVRMSDVLSTAVIWEDDVDLTQGSVAYTLGTVGWEVGALDTGDSATLTFRVQVSTAITEGELLNTAQIETDCDVLTRTASVTVLPRPPAWLYIPIIFKNFWPPDG